MVLKVVRPGTSLSGRDLLISSIQAERFIRGLLHLAAVEDGGTVLLVACNSLAVSMRCISMVYTLRNVRINIKDEGHILGHDQQSFTLTRWSTLSGFAGVTGPPSNSAFRASAAAFFSL